MMSFLLWRPWGASFSAWVVSVGALYMWSHNIC